MRFYLNTLANRVYVEVAPQITETFDESLDSATVVLQANTISTPFAPNQYFYICDDNDNILYTMELALDMVETYSSKPLRYRHTLTLTQNSRNMSKHTVRNSVFTQPLNDYKRGFFATKNMLQKHDHAGGLTTYSWLSFSANYWSEPIKITSRDRVRGDFVIEPQVIGFYYNDHDNVYNPNGDDKPHIFKADMTDFSDGTDIVIKLYKDGVDTGESIVLTSDMLGSKIVVDDFTNYIKNNPLGEYSLYINSNNLFCTKSVTGSTIQNHTPSQYALSINFSIQIYYYDCYDLLELLIERQRLKNFRYARQKLFTLPESGELHDLLVGTIPPNFTFTAATMYECIADIFKLFDAIFTLDNNNVLGIEYLNEYGTENTDKATSSKSTHAEDTYNRGIVNFYQDARVLERFPSGKGYAKARSSGLGVPTSTNDFCILLPHKIEYIDKVEMLNPKIKVQIVYFKRSGDTASATGYAVYDDDIIIDISSFVFESSMWGLLSSGDLSTITSNQDKVQANTTYYQKGDNKIILGLTYTNGEIQTTNYNFSNILEFAWLRLDGQQNPIGVSNVSFVEDSISSDYTSIKTAVTYMASVDGKLEIESINPKFNGEIFVDQSNGAVDLNKLGLNMFGLAQKLGEPTLTKTMQITNFSERIRKGQYIIIDGEKWIANVITHTILNNGKVQSVVNFVKNYNALSLFTRVNKEKRMSTISPDLINKSEILFGEYLYFSSSNMPYSYQSLTKMEMSEICSLFAATFKLNESDTHRVDYAIVSSFDKDNNPYTFNDNGTETTIENIAIPLVKYGAGNSICLEASFSHPKSAGNKTTAISASTWFGNVDYYTNFVPYTDDNGFIDKIDYKLYFKVTDSDLDNYPIIDTTGSDTLVVSLEKLVVDKFSNEIFAINYQIHMLPMNERKDIDFVGSAFINNNAIVKNPEAKNFYIYVSNTYTYSILDTKGQGTRHLITDVNYHSSNNAFELTFEYGTITNTGLVSWAICDEDGNIYFASNTQPGEYEVTLYFACRNQRVEDYDLETYYLLKFTVGSNVTVRGNIGANFVTYQAGTSVELSLEEGTPYHLYTEFAEHWYSDESGWDDETGSAIVDVNLGTSSSGLKESKLTIEWHKNVIAITVGDETYYNPDPSDEFMYETEIWERQGQNINYEITEVTEGYYVRNNSGTWDTDADLTISPVADAYRSIVINWKKGLNYVRIGTISQGYEDFYNPDSTTNYGEQVIRSGIVQYAANTQYACYAVNGWQITSGDSGWSDWSSGDLYIDPTLSVIEYDFEITVGSHSRIDGTIKRNNTTIKTIAAIENQTVSYNDLQYGDIYAITVSAINNNYYLPSGIGYNGTITADTDLGTTESSYYKVGESIANTTYASEPTAQSSYVGKYYVSTSGYYYKCSRIAATYGTLRNTTIYEGVSQMSNLTSPLGVYVGCKGETTPSQWDRTIANTNIYRLSNGTSSFPGGQYSGQYFIVLHDASSAFPWALYPEVQGIRYTFEVFNGHPSAISSARLNITYGSTTQTLYDGNSLYIGKGDISASMYFIGILSTSSYGSVTARIKVEVMIDSTTPISTTYYNVNETDDFTIPGGGSITINQYNNETIFNQLIKPADGKYWWYVVAGSSWSRIETATSDQICRLGSDTSQFWKWYASGNYYSRYYVYDYFLFIGQGGTGVWQQTSVKLSDLTSGDTFDYNSTNYYFNGSSWQSTTTYTWGSGTSASGCAFSYNSVWYYYKNGALH